MAQFLMLKSERSTEDVVSPEEAQQRDPLNGLSDAKRSASRTPCPPIPLGGGSIEPSAMVTLLGQADDEESKPKEIPLPIRQRRLDWATLLRRVYKVDIVACPRCHGRLKLLAAISDPPVVKKILDHLQLPSESPRRAPARAPPQTEMDC